MYAKRPNGFAPAWRKAGPQDRRCDQRSRMESAGSSVYPQRRRGRPSLPRLRAVQHARTGCDDHGSDYDQIHWQILLCN